VPTPQKSDDASDKGAARAPGAGPSGTERSPGDGGGGGGGSLGHPGLGLHDGASGKAEEIDAAKREAEALKRLAEAPDPYVGSILGERYKIIQKLGAGGMGAVYLAEHVVIERKVAIKILSEDFAHKADLVQRFIQEARAAARIGHENIVEVYDFGETASGSVFFAMEYLEGGDLAQLIQKSGPLSAQQVKQVALQICAGLAAAHTKKIVHRDLKPENIFLIEREGRRDFVKILDFGIAKISTVEEGQGRLTRAGMIFGTPEYMSPEQARGETPDHRVDIYALGCIMYEMLTGCVPFQAETFMGTLTKQMFEQPLPPSRRCRHPVPPDLEAVCLKAMEKDRERRFQSMNEVAQALEGEIQLPLPTALQGMQGYPAMPQLPQPMGMPGMPMGQLGPMGPMGMGVPPGVYGMPGQVQAPMPASISGIVQGPMSTGASGVVQAPMQMNSSGLVAGPIMGVPVATGAGYTTAPPTGYELTRPPGTTQWRRLIFVFAGATIGAVVLALVLLWPQPPGPTPRVQPASNGDKNKPQPLRPARLMVRGLPDSRVMVDFRDVGFIPSSGQLEYEMAPPGSAEWSVHIKVVRDDRQEFSIRTTVRAGGSFPVEADQPPASTGSTVQEPGKPPQQQPIKRPLGPKPGPVVSPRPPGPQTPSRPPSAPELKPFPGSKR
jgi:tRNA A-37 threonylcarbamoyl transferase component Bud32